MMSSSKRIVNPYLRKKPKSSTISSFVKMTTMAIRNTLHQKSPIRTTTTSSSSSSSSTAAAAAAKAAATAVAAKGMS